MEDKCRSQYSESFLRLYYFFSLQQTNSHFHLRLSIFIIQCIFEHDNIHSPFLPFFSSEIFDSCFFPFFFLFVSLVLSYRSYRSRCSQIKTYKISQINKLFAPLSHNGTEVQSSYNVHARVGFKFELEFIK